jgi:hypothetical protein
MEGSHIMSHNKFSLFALLPLMCAAVSGCHTSAHYRGGGNEGKVFTNSTKEVHTVSDKPAIEDIHRLNLDAIHKRWVPPPIVMTETSNIAPVAPEMTPEAPDTATEPPDTAHQMVSPSEDTARALPNTRVKKWVPTFSTGFSHGGHWEYVSTDTIQTPDSTKTKLPH